MAAKPLPSQELLLQLLDYDAETGALTWRYRQGGAPQWNKRWPGTPAFTKVISRGYYSGQIAKSDYLAHRIIWKLVHGIDPDTIDHINGNKLDNRICNLRSVPFGQNARNRPKMISNSTGHQNLRQNPNGNWRVTIAGKNIGSFKELDAAIVARDQALSRMGFHQNHGRKGMNYE